MNTPGGRFTDTQKKDILAIISRNLDVGDSIDVMNSSGVHMETITKVSPTSWRDGLGLDLRNSDVRDLLIDLHGIGSKIKFTVK